MSISEISEAAATIDAMADAAAHAFYDNSVKFGIGRYPKGSLRRMRNWPKFVKVARMCFAEKVPVEEFVSKAFVLVMGNHQFVTASDICAIRPSSLKGAADEQESGANPQDLWSMLSCKLMDIRFTSDGSKSMQDVLDDSIYGFPAWFRVFFPEKIMQDVIVHWGDVANDEISSNSKLDKFVREKRPETYNLLKSVVKNI